MENYTDHLITDEEGPIEGQPEELAEWEEARDNAPTNEAMIELESNIQTAQKLLDEAETAYRIAAVKKACVWGWNVIAKDLGVSPKMLHSWHKRYCPDEKDHSKTPAQIAAKEEKRVKRALAAAQKAAIEAEAMEKLARKLELRKDRLNSLTTTY